MADVDVADLAEDLKLTVVSARSVKAGLDIDWQLKDSRKQAALLSHRPPCIRGPRASVGDEANGPPGQEPYGTGQAMDVVAEPA